MIKKMLCVNQAERATAHQLLSHPWITLGDDKLASKDLSNSVVTMKRFNARRRLRAAANAVIMTNRMNNLMMGFRKAKLEIDMDVAKEAMKDDSLEDISADAAPGFAFEDSITPQPSH